MLNFALNKRPPGLIAPLLRFWHLLGNPPINTTKGRDLIFNEGIRLLNMADNIYLYLPHLPLICPYLVIFAINYPNFPIYAIFTLHIFF